MRFARTAFGLLCLTALLTGCNTTDALTPQVDVGGGTVPARSNPVTDSDLQRLAQSQQPVYPRTESFLPAQVDEQPLGPVQTAGTQPPASGAAGRQALGAPPRSLDQQAASLGQKSQPDAVGGTRSPAALQKSAGTAPLSQPAATDPAPNGGAGGETLRFLPVIGAPLQAVTPLSRQLGAEARARGIVIRGAGDTSTKHALKGYFSCVGANGTITITYVWDVLDASGARLNRIQGQESFPGNATDPWSAVPPSVMQTIATKTMDSYLRWSSGP